jgi:hypothetical protein
VSEPAPAIALAKTRLVGPPALQGGAAELGLAPGEWPAYKVAWVGGPPRRTA